MLIFPTKKSVIKNLPPFPESSRTINSLFGKGNIHRLTHVLLKKITQNGSIKVTIILPKNNDNSVINNDTQRKKAIRVFYLGVNEETVFITVGRTEKILKLKKSGYVEGPHDIPVYIAYNEVVEEVKSSDSKVVPKSLNGMNIVYEGFQIEEINDFVRSLGGKMSERLTKNTDILVVMSTFITTQKMTNAYEKGIPIITFNEFINKYNIQY